MKRRAHPPRLTQHMAAVFVHSMVLDLYSCVGLPGLVVAASMPHQVNPRTASRPCFSYEPHAAMQPHAAMRPMQLCSRTPDCGAHRRRWHLRRATHSANMANRARSILLDTRSSAVSHEQREPLTSQPRVAAHGQRLRELQRHRDRYWQRAFDSVSPLRGQCLPKQPEACDTSTAS